MKRSSTHWFRYRLWLLAIATTLLTAFLGIYDGEFFGEHPLFHNAVLAQSEIQQAEIQQVEIQQAEIQQVEVQQVEVQQTLQQAQAHYAAEKFTEALTLWAQAEQHFARQGETLNQATVLSNLALAYRQLGQWPKANSAIAHGLSLLHPIEALSTNGLRIYGQSLNTQGSLQLAQGQTKTALKTWEQATELYTQANYAEGVVKSLINQSHALRSLGFFRESRDRLRQVQTLLADQTDDALKIALTRSLGETQRLMGDLKASTASLKESLALATTLQMPAEIAATTLSLGNTQQADAQLQENLADRTHQQSDRQQAHQQFQMALETYTSLSAAAPPRLQVQAQLNRLGLLLHLNNQTAAQPVYDALPGQIDALPPGRPALFARLKLARLLMDACDTHCAATLNISPQQLYEQLTTARQQAQALSDPIAESYALGYLGRLYKTEEKYADARQLTAAALQLTQQPSIAYQWQWQLGQIESRLNRDIALSHYKAAFQNAQTVRDDLLHIDPNVQFDFRNQVEPLYREYISLLLPANNTSDNTLGNTPEHTSGRISQGMLLKENTDDQDDSAQLSQAQAVIDQLRIAELESFLACGLLQPSDDIPLASLQSVASTVQKTAIIYPIILQDRLEVLIQLPNQPAKRYPSKNLSASSLSPSSLSPSSLSPSSSSAPSLSIREKLSQLRRTLEKPFFSNAEDTALSAEIYDWLIRPAETAGWLSPAQIDTLVFVLDGPFRTVPMGALYDQQAQAFLIEKYAIAVTFGDLKLPAALPQKSFQILAGGLSADPFFHPTEQDSAPDDFGPLSHVLAEIQSIKNKISNTTAILDRDFTREQMSETIRSSAYNIVHLATHGEFGFTRAETFLLAASTSDNTLSNNTPEENSIAVEKIDLNSFDTLLKTRNQTALELLVLSACETASGDDQEVLGIAGLAVQSGARSTLATLWNIDDLSTSVLMEDFYGHLSSPDFSNARSLQNAQIQLIAQGYKPSSWAPYLLVGDWR